MVAVGGSFFTGGLGGWGVGLGNEWGAGGGNGFFTADDRGTSLDFCSWHFHSTVEMPFESIDLWNGCFTIQTPNC